MRLRLQPLEGTRHTFLGTIADRYTLRNQQIRLLLTDVCDAEGQSVTDHVWITLPNLSKHATFALGERLIFRAQVKRYLKRYDGIDQSMFDYGFKAIGRIRNVTEYTVDEYEVLYAQGRWEQQ